MKQDKMLLYGFLVAVVCCILFLMLSLWLVPNKMSFGDNVIWGIIFGVGLGFSCFCFLKGYQETHCGKSRQPFYAHSSLARKIFRLSQYAAMIVWGYLTLCLLTPYGNNTPLGVLGPLGIVFMLFVASVIVARYDRQNNFLGNKH